MFKKLCAVAFAIMIATTATMAGAQCTIAAYGDPAGTESVISPNESFFSLYVVLFAEGTVSAAAYKMTLNGTGFFLQGRVAAGGTGLLLDEDPASIGTNVALGECVLGFNGFPVLVEEYQYAALEGASGDVTLSANTNQDPELPVYVTCTFVEKQCNPGAALVINEVVPTEASSFGSIKSLYN